MIRKGFIQRWYRHSYFWGPWIITTWSQVFPQKSNYYSKKACDGYTGLPQTIPYFTWFILGKNFTIEIWVDELLSQGWVWWKSGQVGWLDQARYADYQRGMKAIVGRTMVANNSEIGSLKPLTNDIAYDQFYYLAHWAGDLLTARHRLTNIICQRLPQKHHE